MKKKAIKILLLSIMVVFLGASFAQAQTPQMTVHRVKAARHWKSPVRSYFLLKEYKEALNLTDDQLSRLKEISFSLEEKLLTLRQKNQILLLEMKKLIDNETPDYAAIEKNVKARAANRAVIIVESLKAKEEAMNVFTEDQIKKIKKFKQARFMRRQWRDKRFY